MGTKIRVKRKCKLCGKEFTARTTVTMYCSDVCGKKGYKEKQREKKIKEALAETQRQRDDELMLIRNMEFVTVRQASLLLNCSRQNVYKMINKGKLTATNILQNKTLIKRIDIDNLFNKPKRSIEYHIQTPITKVVQLDECYTTTEIKERFNVSDRTLKRIIEENAMPKVKYGWFYYVPKELIDKYFNID